MALGIGAPMVINTGVDKFGMCSIIGPLHVMRPYFWFIMVFYMFLPISIVSYCYFKIIYVLIHQTRSNISLNRADLKVQRVKDNKRTIKILMPILFAYVLCVLPTTAIEIYFVYVGSGSIDFDLYRGLVILINVTYPLHACVNPIVYTIVDRRFRTDLLVMFGLQQPERRKSAWTASTVYSNTAAS